MIDRVAIAGLSMALSSAVGAQQPQRDTARPSPCEQSARVQIPEPDLPTPGDRKSLASCDAEDLYFGFDHPADPQRARKCAYIQREMNQNSQENVFGSSGLLTMIYANGKGAARNLDLALKFACELDGAPAENDSRIERLLKLKNENSRGDNFNLCDDATSGFMQGICAGLQEHYDGRARSKKLAEVTLHWSLSEKNAFQRLQQAAKAFFDASSKNEVDLSGTARAEFEIEARASLNDDFGAALERFEKGQLPSFNPSDFSKSDTELNSYYSKIQANPDETIGSSTITLHGVRIAQRAWLSYREAWVKFASVKYPNVAPESWRTWLTQERVKMLKSLAE